METKKAKVIMLPTENGNNIPLLKNLRNGGSKGHLFKATSNYHYTQSYLKSEQWEAQHLYITIDDEIKEGDWCIVYTLAGTNYLVQYRNGKYFHPSYNGGGYNTEEEVKGRVRKIIATTDKSLELNIHKGKDNVINQVFLPQPYQAFIEKYCKVGGIDEVLVEYETKCKSISALCTASSFINGCPSCDYKLKVDSHNTITIHPIKEKTYTYEQIRLAFQAGARYGYCKRSIMANIGATCSEPDEEDWIKENL